MKFKIERTVFIDGLKKVQNIVSPNASLLIVQNVLLEAKEDKLFLTTTNDFSGVVFVTSENVNVE